MRIFKNILSKVKTFKLGFRLNEIRAFSVADQEVDNDMSHDICQHLVSVINT